MHRVFNLRHRQGSTTISSMLFAMTLAFSCSLGTAAKAEKKKDVEKADAAEKKDEKKAAVQPAPTEQVLEFNGYSSYVDVAHIPFDEMKEFTIEAWVKNWHATLVYQGHEGDPENSVWMGWGTRGWFSGWEANDGANFVHKHGDKFSYDWEHVAIVCDGKFQYIFADGKLIHKIEAPKPGKMVKERRIFVGGQETWQENQTGPAQRLGGGYLAALRISHKALYTEPFKPPEKFTADDNTELLFDLSKQDDTILYDMSKKHRDGTIFEATWRTWKETSK